MTDSRACLVCSRPVHDPYSMGDLLCGDCRDTLKTLLLDCGRWWQHITRPGALHERPEGAGRRSPGFTSAPPGRLDIMAITDRRLYPDPDRPGDLRYPPDVINGWAAYVDGLRDDWGSQRAAAYLAGHVTWLARQDWVRTLWDEVRRVHTQLRAVSPDAAGAILVGHCPTEVDTGVRCGTRLYRAPDADVIPCYGCGSRWRKPEWWHLGQQIEEAAG